MGPTQKREREKDGRQRYTVGSKTISDARAKVDREGGGREREREREGEGERESEKGGPLLLTYAGWGERESRAAAGARPQCTQRKEKFAAAVPFH